MTGPRPDDDDTAGLPPLVDPEEVGGLFAGGGSRGSGRGGRAGPRAVPLPWDEEPSAIVSRYLFPTEKFRGEWRKHWIHIVHQFFIAAGVTLAFGWLAGFLTKQKQQGFTVIAVIAWFAALMWVAWKVLDWYFDRFILTNKRIMEVKGIITRTVAMMPLLRVTDMKYTQSALGRILGYGTFELESAGQDQALRNIENLPDPNELYLRIVEEMYEPEAVEARATANSEPGSTDDGI